ncbi:hypothetical protein ACIBVL_14835 [Streptomyces sp. NPDC049687]|uniref:hypothetical protein n=1 Tax=Streptomyces sp. NPDC049687 TaxID=3365596 RepID=UPI0037A60338
MHLPSAVRRPIGSPARLAMATIGAGVLAVALTVSPASAQSGAFIWYDSNGDTQAMIDPIGVCLELVPAADPAYPVDNATDARIQVFADSCEDDPLADLNPGDREMLSPATAAYHIKVWPTD